MNATILIFFLFDQLDNDDISVPRIVIDALIKLIEKTFTCSSECYRRITEIAREKDDSDILVHFQESEISEKAHKLYDDCCSLYPRKNSHLKPIYCKLLLTIASLISLVGMWRTK